MIHSRIAPNGATIRELLAVAQSGSDGAPTAVARILKAHEGIVVAAVRHARALDRSPDQDLMQEGRCAVLVAIEAYRPGSAASFATFASLVVKRAVERAAIRGHRDASELAEAPGESGGAASKSMPFDEEVTIRELVRTTPLSQRARRVVFGRYWLQQTQVEIGDRLGVSHAAIQKHEQRALSQLHKSFVA